MFALDNIRINSRNGSIQKDRKDTEKYMNDKKKRQKTEKNNKKHQ